MRATRNAAAAADTKGRIEEEFGKQELLDTKGKNLTAQLFLSTCAIQDRIVGRIDSNADDGPAMCYNG